MLTCGKDGRVHLTRLREETIGSVRAWEDVCQGGVVKTCQWHPTDDVFAASGRGGDVRVYDSRSATPSMTIREAHARDVHCVRFQPPTCAACPLLLTAANDPVIKLWDLRYPSQPLRNLTGHVAPGVAMQKRIHQPSFGALGDTVVATGQGMACVSVFAVSTGELREQISMDGEPTALSSAEQSSSTDVPVMAVAQGRFVRFLVPVTARGIGLNARAEEESAG